MMVNVNVIKCIQCQSDKSMWTDPHNMTLAVFWGDLHNATENIAGTVVVALIMADMWGGGIGQFYALVVGSSHKLRRDFQSLLTRSYILIDQCNHSACI